MGMIQELINKSSSGIVNIPKGQFDEEIEIPDDMVIHGVSRYASTVQRIKSVGCRCDIGRFGVFGSGGVGMTAPVGHDMTYWHDMVFGGFDLGWALLGGTGWGMARVYCVNNKNGFTIENRRLADQGDNFLRDITIDTNRPESEVGFTYMSSGGLNGSNIKVLHHKIGMKLEMVEGAKTADLNLHDVSFELQTEAAAILGKESDEVTFGDINLTGFQSMSMGGADGIIMNKSVQNVCMTGGIVRAPGKTGITIRSNGVSVCGTILDNCGLGVNSLESPLCKVDALYKGCVVDILEIPKPKPEEKKKSLWQVLFG